MGKKKENTIDVEEIHEEMELIQACITRMADNSFRLKELYISLIAVALTVMMSQTFSLLSMGGVLLGVIFIFWGLDAFFLKMETVYRWKYEWVIVKRFFGVKEYMYDLNPNNKYMWLELDDKNTCFKNFIFNKTLKPLYGTIAAIVGVMLIIAVMKG